MNIIKIWLEKQKQKSIRQRALELSGEFKVIERGGKLWLTHMGVAFKRIQEDTCAQDVARELSLARETAVMFDATPTPQKYGR